MQFFWMFEDLHKTIWKRQQAMLIAFTAKSNLENFLQSNF